MYRASRPGAAAAALMVIGPHSPHRRICLQPDTPQLLHDRYFAVVDAFDTVATRGFDRMNIAYETAKSLRLDRSCLIAAPHRAIESDMPFDHAGAKRHRRNRGCQPDFMPRIADRDAIACLQG